MTMQTAPVTAQNVLPVIEEPVITFVPWPTQTAPVRNRTAPTTRLRMVTNGTTRGANDWFGVGGRRG